MYEDILDRNSSWGGTQVDVVGGGRMGYGIILSLGGFRGTEENFVAIKIAIEGDKSNSDGDWVLLNREELQSLSEKLRELSIFMGEPLGGQGVETA